MSINSMSPYRCVSSHMMSSLMTWRNKEGKEANWTEVSVEKGEEGSNSLVDSPIDWNHTFKKITAEISVCILLVTSLVETTTYFVFTSATFFISFSKPQPYEISKKLLSSSIFTIGWTAKNLYKNLFEKNLLTHESFERAQSCLISDLILPRYEDISFICRANSRDYKVNDVRINILRIFQGTWTNHFNAELFARALGLMVKHKKFSSEQFYFKFETQRLLRAYLEEKEDEEIDMAQMKEIAHVELQGGDSYLTYAAIRYALKELKKIKRVYFSNRDTIASDRTIFFERDPEKIRLYLTTVLILNFVSHLLKKDDPQEIINSFSIFKEETNKALLSIVEEEGAVIAPSQEEIQDNLEPRNFFNRISNPFLLQIKNIAERELDHDSLITLIPIKMMEVRL